MCVVHHSCCICLLSVRLKLACLRFLHLYSGVELHKKKKKTIELWTCKWEKDCTCERLLWTNTVTIISQLNFPLRDYKQRQICCATYCPIRKQIAVIKCCRKRCSILCFSTEIVQFSVACWEKRIRFIYKDKNHFHQWKCCTQMLREMGSDKSHHARPDAVLCGSLIWK